MEKLTEPGHGRGQVVRFGALVWLHLVLAYRHSSGSTRQQRVLSTVGLVVVVGMVGLVSFSVAVLVYKVTRGLGATSSGAAGVLVAFGLFFSLLFTVVGVFEKGMGCGIDLSRLFHLPVPPWSMLAAGLVSRLAAPHTVLPLGLIVAYPLAVAADGHPALAVVFAPAAALWLFQLNLLSMVVNLLNAGARRSRRLVERVVVGAVAIGVLDVGVMLSPLQVRVDAFFRWLSDLVGAHWQEMLPALRFLPGVSGLAWQGGGRFDPVVLVVAVAEAAALYVGGTALLRRFTVTGVDRASSRRPTVRGGEGRAVPRRPRPFESLPILAKELRVTLRDPAGQLELLVFALLPLAGGLALTRVEPRVADAILHHVMPLVVLFMIKDRFCNHLCREGGGLLLLVGSPFPRWRLLLEKNLVTVALAMALMTVPCGILLWRGTPWGAVLLDCTLALSLALVMAGVGNFPAMLAPIPMQLKKGQLSPQVPMARLFLTEILQLVVLYGAAWLALPIVALHLVYIELPQPALTTSLAFGCTVAYGAALYALLLVKAADILAACEPDLVEEVVRAGG